MTDAHDAGYPPAPTETELGSEFVGEIHDEYDRDVRDAVRHADGSVTVVGHFPVHDLVDLDIHLPEGDYVTVADVVHDRLGRLPDAGDSVEVNRWRITVLGVQGRTTQHLRIDPLASEDADASG